LARKHGWLGSTIPIPASDLSGIKCAHNLCFALRSNGLKEKNEIRVNLSLQLMFCCSSHRHGVVFLPVCLSLIGPASYRMAGEPTLPLIADEDKKHSKAVAESSHPVNHERANKAVTDVEII